MSEPTKREILLDEVFREFLFEEFTPETTNRIVKLLEERLCLQGDILTGVDFDPYDNNRLTGIVFTKSLASGKSSKIIFQIGPL